MGNLLRPVCCLLFAAGASQAQHAFPAGFIPFTSIYYVTPPDSHGDQLVVGKMTMAAWGQIPALLPLPGLPNETFTDARVQLAPGVSFSGIYIPTAVERGGNFSAFGGALIDPASGLPIPGNLIPGSRLPDPWAFRVQAAAGTIGLGFYAVTPCRVADTRAGTGKTGSFGPPGMAAGSSRDFAIPLSGCGVPETARAYSLNLTVVPHGPLSYLSAWPAGQPQPYVSTLNSFDGRVVANAAIVPAGGGGAVSVYSSDATDVIVDINGYFAPPDASALAFYPLAPCRVADTRAGSGKTGAFGPPALGGGTSRAVPMQSSGCAVPSAAKAYSLNITVVPPGQLIYLTAWPAGQPQPNVSTLNSLTGDVVANAAIVPGADNGDISVFVSDPSDVIVDINGYFAPSGGAGALWFYPAAPCRVADTRPGQTPSGLFGPPAMAAGASRDFPIPEGQCNVPATARAYSFNMTVVPPGPLIYLTTWPQGQAQPLASTLNSFLGKVLANAALVPAGTDGISVFASNTTDLIVDVNGFFADSAGLIPTPPSNAVHLANLDDDPISPTPTSPAPGTWGQCTASDCGPLPTQSSFTHSTTSVDGNALAVYNSGTPYWGVLSFVKNGQQNSATNYLVQWQFRIDQPWQKVQAVEFDFPASIGGRWFYFGSECVQGGTWDIWDQNVITWKHTALPCNGFTLNQWHTIRWYGTRTATAIHYVALEVDGQQFQINTWINAPPTTWEDNFIVQFQPDGDSHGDGYTMYVDNVHAWVW